MSVISRRQKELLLNDVYRMINNNNHTAFANHAKIAETVSNGDLKLFIDSPKKEFVIKYGKNEIRINCSDQCIKELKEVCFSNNSKIKGISDDITIPSSTVALSTKGASELLRDLNKEHNHDDKYASIDHTHDDKYSTIDHIHNEYSTVGHIHNEYSVLGHTHNNYASKNHTHWDLPADREDFEEEIKTIVGGSKTWRVFKNIVSGFEIASDVVQYGVIAGLQAQVNALHAAMAANGLIDTAQTTSTLGTALLGYSNKIKSVGDVITKIGKSFESVSGICKKIIGPINEASQTVGKYAKIVDNYVGCKNKVEVVARIVEKTKIDPKYGKLPKITDALLSSVAA